jgi:aerobic-type carbon monoxide dehydrogenase small subunit (CoxS/CutS family)
MRVLSLSVNGDEIEVAAPDHWSLLEVLRYKLGLTGSKQGCDKGDCGACTVLADGKPILACITLAALCEGREITTIEGLMPLHLRNGGSGPDPVQAAFDKCGALQCGFCQPGMMLSARALLNRNACPTRAEIREALSGNLCRCTGYTQIFEAVELAVAEALGVTPAPRSWEAQHMKPEDAQAAARTAAQALSRARDSRRSQGANGSPEVRDFADPRTSRGDRDARPRRKGK